MNVNVMQDKRQPWHLLARVGGGYQIVDQMAWMRLQARVEQIARPVTRRVRKMAPVYREAVTC